MAVYGQCFCGKVSYSISGRLHSAESCHCSRCRKMFSSQASVIALFEREQFSWLTGEELLTSFNAGKDCDTQFCSVCGSTLGGLYKGQFSWITLGCVEGDPDIEIGRHIFVGSKAEWEVMPEGVTCYKEWPL